MSVSERRMFVLIWLFGGGRTGDTVGAEGAGCGGLEDEEWLEGAEEGGVDGTLEDEEDGGSFCGGCFLGMVKLDLVTLSAPVAWIGPWGKRDLFWTGIGPGFLDFAAVLLRGVAGFFDAFEVVVWGFLPFGETLAALVAVDFLFPLVGAGAFAWAGSFSLCFSSLGGAANQEDTYMLKYAIICNISRNM